jgi:hypothetical protein
VTKEARSEAREAIWVTEAVALATIEAVVEDSEEARNSGPIRV